MACVYIKQQNLRRVFSLWVTLLGQHQSQVNSLSRSSECVWLVSSHEPNICCNTAVNGWGASPLAYEIAHPDKSRQPHVLIPLLPSKDGPHCLCSVLPSRINLLSLHCSSLLRKLGTHTWRLSRGDLPETGS